MDIAFDTTWCPVCSRQILPKRILVPVQAANAPTTPAPPPSPTSQPKTDAPQARITRNKTVRPLRGGGLVHGTGRVKPNGTIKRPSPKDTQATAAKKVAPAAVPSNATTPIAPVRHRTIIDQTPVPLYCSDECRLADLQSSQGIDINYNPARHASPPLPPVPPNSAADISPAEESDSGIGSSLDSEASSIPSTCSQNAPPSPTSSTSSGTEKESRTSGYPVPKRYAALASIYDLPPCPPPPPLLRTDTSSSSSGESEKWDTNYESGIIMAGRRIQEALATRPEPKKMASWSTPSAMLSTTYALTATRQNIPGWTDGSDKWRASVYSFANLSKDNDKTGRDEERLMRAYTYKGIVSTPLRSQGVYSTLGEHDSERTPSTSVPGYNPGPQMERARSEAEELYSKFDFSFARRSESRSSFGHQASTSPTGSTRSLPATTGSYIRRKEVPILKKGAEGKLLVPDVKMRRVDSTTAMSSCSSSYTGTTASGSVYGGRRRSPLSRQNSEASVADDEQDVTVRSPIQPSAGSWSYKDEFVYPIMQLPQKEKRMVRHVVDGKEVEEEVEVEVIPERKRLFLFPGKPSQH